METKKQTAMRQLLNQLREERDSLPMDAEWNRCFQAIESVIESKYIPIEKEQIKYSFGQGSLFDPVFPEQFHYRADDYYQHHYGQ
jgi:hypothetical protein